jgi:vitamin B12 transport system substrate-binding protein
MFKILSCLSLCYLLVPIQVLALQDETHPNAAQRVISLAPSSTELAFSAGLGDKLLAVSEYSDYPEQAKGLERVANYKSINVERIVALKPDLILAWRAGNPQKPLEQLKALGFTVYYTDSKAIEDIPRVIAELSQYSENPEVGIQKAENFTQQLQSIKAHYQQQQPVRYFYQLSAAPIITVSDGNWPAEVFALCGGENIFAHSSVPYPQVGLEQVVVAQPEVLFTSYHDTYDVALWKPWENQVPAVKNQHIWTLTADWINRPTERTLLAIEQVCQYLDQVRRKRLP